MAETCHRDMTEGQEFPLSAASSGASARADWRRPTPGTTGAGTHEEAVMPDGPVSSVRDGRLPGSPPAVRGGNRKLADARPRTCGNPAGLPLLRAGHDATRKIRVTSGPWRKSACDRNRTSLQGICLKRRNMKKQNSHRHTHRNTPRQTGQDGGTCRQETCATGLSSLPPNGRDVPRTTLP